MELLIPGLILVALMAYASTRIKRSAARAFESETIETDEFVIQKPEGFLNVLNGDPKFAFESYSKPYGQEPAQEFRQCTAKLRIIENSGLAKVTADIKNSGDRDRQRYKRSRQ